MVNVVATGTNAKQKFAVDQLCFASPTVAVARLSSKQQGARQTVGEYGNAVVSHETLIDSFAETSTCRSSSQVDRFLSLICHSVESDARGSDNYALAFGPQRYPRDDGLLLQHGSLWSHFCSDKNGFAFLSYRTPTRLSGLFFVVSA